MEVYYIPQLALVSSTPLSKPVRSHSESGVRTILAGPSSLNISPPGSGMPYKETAPLSVAGTPAASTPSLLFIQV